MINDNKEGRPSSNMEALKKASRENYLREHRVEFAKAAMQGLLSGLDLSGSPDREVPGLDIAKVSVQMADLLIQELGL